MTTFGTAPNCYITKFYCSYSNLFRGGFFFMDIKNSCFSAHTLNVHLDPSVPWRSCITCSDDAGRTYGSPACIHKDSRISWRCVTSVNISISASWNTAKNQCNLWCQQSQILKSRCHTKRRMGAATAPILLLVWHRLRPLGTCLHDAAHVRVTCLHT